MRRPALVALGGALTSAVVLLSTVGLAAAQTDAITTRDQALQSITDGLAMIDNGQAKIVAGQDWLAANTGTEDPPPTGDPEPPADETTATATVIDDRRTKVDWTTTRTDITGWHIGRDGTDTSGYGTWSTDLPAEARTFTFDLLRAGDTYTFTLTPKTAAGNLDPVTTSVTMGGTSPAPDPTEDPEPTDPPPAGDGDTAAAVHGWGTPIAAGSDEFNGTSLDLSKWNQPGECWPANDTVKAGRCASHNSVQNGHLRETMTPDGKTGWVASKFGQKYGHWEVRARVITEQPGHAGHPVLITWPDSDQWPAGAEYDYLEVNSDSTRAEAFLHFPNHQPRRQEHAVGPNLDLSQWHNFGFSWEPDGLTGYIDGVEWFHFDQDGIQNAPGPMHQTIQLDNFVGTSGMAKVHFDVDWARVYAP